MLLKVRKYAEVLTAIITTLPQVWRVFSLVPNSYFYSATPRVEQLLEFDILIIAGQAKSHCVAWTVDDLLTEIQVKNPELTKKVYLLEDCSSPVVVPNVVDYTDQANSTFERFAAAGMHLVKSTQPISSWPNIML